MEDSQDYYQESEGSLEELEHGPQEEAEQEIEELKQDRPVEPERK